MSRIATKGFSLVELTVSIGISALVALGTSQILIKNIAAHEAVKDKSNDISLAAEIRNELFNARVRRIQFEGQSASAKAGCANTLVFVTPASGLEKAYKPEGAPISVNFALGGGGTISGDPAANQAASSSGKRIRALDLSFGNAFLVTGDNSSETISGEIYVTVATEKEYQANIQRRRKIYVGRMTAKVLKSGAGAGTITECHLPNTAGNTISYCNEQLGYFYDVSVGYCVYKQTAYTDNTKLKICGPGQHAINVGGLNQACVTSGSSGDCTSTTAMAGKEYINGRFRCAAFGAIDAPALPPPGGTRPSIDRTGTHLAGVSVDCVPINNAYQDCLDAAAFTGTAGKCNAPPKQNCSRAYTDYAPSQMVTPPPSSPSALPNKCRCGAGPGASGEINVNWYCGYCTTPATVTKGFGMGAKDDGAGENYYEVFQCAANGQLARVGDGNNVNASDFPNCNGDMIRATLDGGGNFRF